MTGAMAHAFVCEALGLTPHHGSKTDAARRLGRNAVSYTQLTLQEEVPLGVLMSLFHEAGVPSVRLTRTNTGWSVLVQKRTTQTPALQAHNARKNQ